MHMSRLAGFVLDLMNRAFGKQEKLHDGVLVAAQQALAPDNRVCHALYWRTNRAKRACR